MKFPAQSSWKALCKMNPPEPAFYSRKLQSAVTVQLGDYVGEVVEELFADAVGSKVESM